MKNTSTNVLSKVNTASQNGIQIDASQIYQASFQAISGDATAAGTLKVQMSNDICTTGYSPTTFTVTNWTDIPSATATITAGASVVINLNNTSYRWMRVVYTRSSGGSTVINVNMFAICV